MMLSSLLLTVMCCIFLIGSAQGQDLYSRRTGSSQVGAKYKISSSQALRAYLKPRQKHYRQCYDGPVKTVYYQPGYYYWPPVNVWSCDGLICRRPVKCLPTYTRNFYRWVVVYKCTKRYCYFYGIRYLKFTHDLRCKCAECTNDSHCKWYQKCSKYTWKCEKKN